MDILPVNLSTVIFVFFGENSGHWLKAEKFEKNNKMTLKANNFLLTVLYTSNLKILRLLPLLKVDTIQMVLFH